MKSNGNNILKTFNTLVYIYGCMVFLEANGQSCSCIGGCIFSTTCAPDGNCNKENVAMGKHATMSSYYNSSSSSTSLETSGPACLAVNGNTTSIFAPINIYPSHPNCISTSQFEVNAFWQVDLGQVFAVSSIIIYMRNELQERMSGVEVRVDGALCYEFGNVTKQTLPQNSTDIKCTSTLSGRIVKLTKNDNVLEQNRTFLRLLELCEVQVWVCKFGRYGEHCNLTCGTCVNNATCNGWNGSCPEITTTSTTTATTTTPTTTTTQSTTSLTSTTLTLETRVPTSSESANVDISTKAPYITTDSTPTPLMTETITERRREGEATSKAEFPLYPVIGAAVGGGVLMIVIVLILCLVMRKKLGHKLDVHELQERSTTRRDSESQSVYVIKKEAKKKAEVRPAFLRVPNKSMFGEKNGYTNFAMDEQASKAGSVSDDENSDYVVIYDNDDSIYAALRDGNAQTDSALLNLIDSLVAGELPDKYTELPKGFLHEHGTSKSPLNCNKNRVMSVVPYEYNRIVLKDGYVAVEATDYVNASYIQGYQDRNTYIATQGPRDNTVSDFWRMVWQEQITQIVMLANVSEEGKDQCWEYWPLRDSSETHGPVTVTGLHVEKRAHFMHRTFLVKAEGSPQEREVEQYHFQVWPEVGMPSVTSMVNFWRLTRARAPQHPPPPVLVHCSNGAGRTGVYIGLEIAHQHLRHAGEVHIFEVVKQLRQERCMMVQDVEHFMFLHKLLLEAYAGRDTTMALDLFDATFQRPISAKTQLSRIDKEFQTLMWMHKLTANRTCTAAEHHENLNKNRNKDSLPADENLVVLRRRFAGRNKYINAVFFSTFRERNGDILTQLPLPDTIVDFWRMVDENDIKIIVSLGSEEEERNTKDYCRYWPRPPSKMMEVGVYSVTLQNVSKIGDHLTSYTVSLNMEHRSDGSRDIRVLHFEGWEGDLPTSTSELLHLIDTLESTRAHFTGSPVVIQCMDGSSKSGLFCALCDVISRVTHDKEVDVYMTIRELHNVRPQAVTSVVQYRYCYEVAQRRVKNLIMQSNTTLRTAMETNTTLRTAM